MTVKTGPATRSQTQSPLSFAQEFLCAFDNGDAGGPFGPRYHNVRGWRLRGSVDVAVLEAALTDLVRRHEALRTVLVRDAEVPHQKVMPVRPPELRVHDLSGGTVDERDRRAETFLGEVEAGTLPVDDLPLLRAHLGRFDEQDAVLVLLAHHVGSDGWSMRLLMRDLAAHYAARRDGAQLPAPAPQYRDFTGWQRDTFGESALDAPRAYWREALSGAAMVGVPMDRPRSAEAEKVTYTHRFILDAHLTAGVTRTAAALRCSPFMVLLSAYDVLLHRVTGIDDITIPTITSGRGEPRFDDTVGPFFNFVPLRTRLAGCRTLGDVVLRSRTTVLEAQAEEIPFGRIVQDTPGIMATFARDDVAVGALQVFQHPFGSAGTLDAAASYTEIRERSLPQPVSSTIPDGTLWTLDVDPGRGIYGNVKFNHREFDVATIAGLVEQYTAVLAELVTSPESPVLPG